MDDEDRDPVENGWAVQSPTWWCDDADVLSDLVTMTLRQLEDVEIEPIDVGTMWFIEADGHRCLVSIQDLDLGIEVSTALAYDVPTDHEATAAVLGFNRHASPARHWLSDDGLLMAGTRVSARPFVGALLIEALQIVFGASANSRHAAVACGGTPTGVTGRGAWS